jgi:hypothetical protein
LFSAQIKGKLFSLFKKTFKNLTLRRIQMSLTKRAAAELIGTFWLVLGGCGSAVLAAGIPDLGIGYLGV